METSEILKRQLDKIRFERALEVTESLAEHRALLTTFELARLNQILVGKQPARQPGDESGTWRESTTTITLPSGRSETLTLIIDPKITAREKLHRATQLAEDGAVIDAAVGIYTDLVLAHVFEDANRRTAVLASHYFFRRYGVPISGTALHDLPLGDIREPGQIESLRQTVEQMAKFAEKNSKKK
jgi:prophage maintenance system killer protein